MVLRFNRARVRGHEEDVGMFWTHWCCTFLDKFYPGIKGFPISEIVCCDKPFSDKVKFDWEKLPCESVMYMPPQLIDEVKKKYDNDLGFFKPSTGIRLLWWIFRETGERITRSRLFGFDCFGVKSKTKDRRSTSEIRSRKYYNVGRPSPRHWPLKERAILDEITT